MHSSHLEECRPFRGVTTATRHRCLSRHTIDAYSETMDARSEFATGLARGGTITGEYSVGSTKAQFLPDELDDASQALHLVIKDALDPRNILSPGKMLAHLGG